MRTVGRGVKHTGAAVLTMALLPPLQAGLEFAVDLPAVLPELAAWEKVTGSAELTQPHVTVNYELYVNPSYNGRYEVIRFRIGNARSHEPGRDYRPTERLQWHSGQKDVRRFECEPPRDAAPCRWRELQKDSEEYRREASVVIWVLGLHRRLLEERDAGRLPP